MHQVQESGLLSRSAALISRRRALAAVLVLLAALALAPSPVAAQQAPVATDDSAGARALLMRMADTLVKAKIFSVTMNDSYDVVQSSGQKIEFGNVRRIVVSRPSGLRVDVTRRSGDREQILFDGTTMTLFDPDQNVYGRATRPGTVDQILYYIVQDLQTPVPLVLLLVTTLPKELEDRIHEIALVGHETLDGKAVDHIAARTDYIDFQMWITTGDQPVPLRAVLTYKHAAGEPQFAASLSDWNFAPAIDAATFAFVPPAGAEAVAFMVPAAGKPGPHRIGK
jgi:hypothetical protein